MKIVKHLTIIIRCIVSVNFSTLFQKTVNDAYKKLLNISTVVPPDQLFCGLMNISSCNVTEDNKMVRTCFHCLGYMSIQLFLFTSLQKINFECYEVIFHATF